MELGLILFVITFIIAGYLQTDELCRLAKNRGRANGDIGSPQNFAQLARNPSQNADQSAGLKPHCVGDLSVALRRGVRPLFWLIWILMSTITGVLRGMSGAVHRITFTWHLWPAAGTAGGGLANALAGGGLLIYGRRFSGTPLGIMAGISGRIWPQVLDR